MEINTKPKPFCFVLMPFDASFNDTYEFGIRGACIESGFYCERVDEQVFFGSMLDRIYSQISKADILVADMTGRNANVFYEVGYAHALGKNVVLLTRSAEDIPFDLKHFPHIVYGSEIRNLRDRLARTLQHLISERSSVAGPKHLALDLFCGTQPLGDGGLMLEFSPNHLPGATLTIVNGSTRTYGSGDFRVAVIAPSPIDSTRSSAVTVTPMPDGSFMHMLPEFDTLFPGAATELQFYLDSRSDDVPDEFKVVVRVLTSDGLRDSPLEFRKAPSRAE